MTFEPIRLGVAGLGRAFMLTELTFRTDPRVQLVAASEPRQEGRDAFERDFGGRGYQSVEALCADPEVEVIYIATPHQMHADHVITATRAGKHVLVDKPLAVSMQDAHAMISAAEEANVHLIVGPSHSFDAPIALARKLIKSRQFGNLRMIQAMNYTDFLYRARRPEELRTEEGGGVLFSQAVHQIDLVRLLAGGHAARVMAMTGAWDSARPTEGAYSALMSFTSGSFATLTYSGYAHFDSDIWMGDVGELGQKKSADAYGKARLALRGLNPEDEAMAKISRTFGAGSPLAVTTHHEHFGPVIALCDRADLRLTPDGVEVFGDTERTFIKAPLDGTPRTTVIDALVLAVRHNESPTQHGAWGRASLEVCHAIMKSAESGDAVDLNWQCGIKGELS